MNKNDKITTLKSINSESDIHDLLINLLPHIGYGDVTLTHERGNRPEFGKDIIASVNDKIENRKEWTAFVIKRGDISGNSGIVDEVARQVKECFEYEWNSIVKGKNIRMNKVKIVCNGTITSGAVDKILLHNAFNNPNISFWKTDEIIKHIDDYFPDYWLSNTGSFNNFFSAYKEHIKFDSELKVIGVKDDKIGRFVEDAIQPRFAHVYISDEGTLKNQSLTFDEVSHGELCSLIVGEPGSGKSVFFKQAAIRILEKAIKENTEIYPLILRFVDLKKCNYDIIHLINEFFSTPRYLNMGFDVNKLLQDNKIILLIDALDEVGRIDDRNSCLDAIRAFRTAYPKARFICSSRPSDSLITQCRNYDFRYLDIKSISYQQVESFIGKYFLDDVAKSSRLIASLKDSKILDKLPKTPLTLALITTIFDEREVEIPATLTDLYRRFSDLLIGRTEASTTLDMLKVGVIENVISYIGYHMHSNRYKSISVEKITALLINYRDERGHEYDVEELLTNIINGTGILIYNDRNDIEFKHVSFQEFFCSHHIYNSATQDRDMLVRSFNDTWWQNVVLFYAGFSKDSSHLIEDVITHSVPDNFFDYIINISGMGYLLQALYNTPSAYREIGIERSLANTAKAIEFIINTNDAEYDFIRRYINTQYGAYRIISYWFEFHHRSITLTKPILNIFNKTILSLRNNTAENRAASEYQAYLLGTILYELHDTDVRYLEEVLDATSSENKFILSLIDGYTKSGQHRSHYIASKRRAFRKFRNKIEAITDNRKLNIVNTKLIDGKVLRKPIRYSKKHRKT